MKDFQKFLGLGVGAGVLIFMWRVGEKVDGRVVETLMSVFVTGVTLALLALSGAYVYSKVRQEPRYEKYEPPVIEATKVFPAQGYLPAPERKWEFKDGSND